MKVESVGKRPLLLIFHNRCIIRLDVMYLETIFSYCINVSNVCTDLNDILGILKKGTLVNNMSVT